MPATFTLPGKFEAQRLEEYMSANKGAFYIAKPQNGGQGDGMHIFKDWKDVSGSVSKGSECVVQRYIDKPLTLEGVKFDLRVYVVVIGVGEQMRGYICDEGLARFCTTNYEKPSPENFKKIYMHLTNYSINRLSDDYISTPQDEDILKETNGHKRTLQSLQ